MCFHMKYSIGKMSYYFLCFIFDLQDIQPCLPTKESLSQLLISFIQFQEKNFGRKSCEPPIMRFPMRCFFDFKPGGSLCHFFSNIYRFKADQRLTKIDFDGTETYIRMLKEVYNKMTDQKCFRLPTAYIQSDIDDDLRKEITQILNDRQCEITEDQAQASHIIYPKLEHSPEDYARPSFKQGDYVMIHWYFLPESYDSWIPNTYDLPVSIN